MEVKPEKLMLVHHTLHAHSLPLGNTEHKMGRGDTGVSMKESITRKIFPHLDHSEKKRALA